MHPEAALRPKTNRGTASIARLRVGRSWPLGLDLRHQFPVPELLPLWQVTPHAVVVYPDKGCLIPAVCCSFKITECSKSVWNRFLETLARHRRF